MKPTFDRCSPLSAICGEDLGPDLSPEEIDGDSLPLRFLLPPLVCEADECTLCCAESKILSLLQCFRCSHRNMLRLYIEMNERFDRRGNADPHAFTFRWTAEIASRIEHLDRVGHRSVFDIHSHECFGKILKILVGCSVETVHKTKDLSGRGVGLSVCCQHHRNKDPTALSTSQETRVPTARS